MTTTEYEVGQVIEKVRADLALSGLDPRIGVFDLADRGWAAGRGDHVPDGFGGEGSVLTVAGNDHLIDETSGGQLDVLDVVREIQEWAIGELGRGWPELYDRRGQFVAVLRPVRHGSGYAWSDGTGSRIPIGSLNTHPLTPDAP